MANKLLITGGGGFCGSHLAEHFASTWKVRLFDSFLRDSLKYAPGLRSNPNVEVLRGDILDRDAVRNALDGCSTVFHCAAIAGVSSYYEKSVETLRVNILGTFNLLDAMVERDVKRVVYFSTSEIYGPNARNVRETDAPTSGPVSQRRWVYSVSKLSGEHTMLRYGETYGIGVTVIRPFNVYGPRQIGEGAVSNFCRCLTVGKPLEIYGDGGDVRAWCHVQDLTSAMALIVDNPDANGRVFNIGNPDASVTTAELADRLVAINGSGSITKVPSEHSPIRLRSPDISLARSVLSFQPRVGLEEGLRNTLNWFKSISA
ncbi:MAG TPA: NAD(P)-dependent oxidoreductase [Gemmataceae bacterium]|jgi:nucleoside-diphosphate-sugar epimerase|nr:NAD(P)-dependent oxidoreductase [Gemmataceae bacterium]